MVKKAAKVLGFKFDPKIMDKPTCAFLARAGCTLVITNMPMRYREEAISDIMDFAFRWWRLPRK